MGKLDHLIGSLNLVQQNEQILNLSNMYTYTIFNHIPTLEIILIHLKIYLKMIPNNICSK